MTDAEPPPDVSSLPPPPLPPVVQAGPAESTSSGLSPTIGATLASLGGWVTGLLFLALERDSPVVRFHAAQAVVGTGGLWLAGVLCWCTSFAAVFLSAALFRVLMVAAQACWVAGLLVWAVCVFWAWRGDRKCLPYVGGIVLRLARTGSAADVEEADR
jgi:uncharacterized membrane protein